MHPHCDVPWAWNTISKWYTRHRNNSVFHRRLCNRSFLYVLLTKLLPLIFWCLNMVLLSILLQHSSLFQHVRFTTTSSTSLSLSTVVINFLPFFTEFRNNLILSCYNLYDNCTQFLVMKISFKVLMRIVL